MAYTATFPVTSVCTRWRSYLFSRLRSDGLLTAQTLNSLVPVTVRIVLLTVEIVPLISGIVPVVFSSV